MCRTLVSSYTFSPGPSTSGTITFTGYTSITRDNILMIINVTSNVVIYDFIDPAKGGTVSTNVLTLQFDTSSMGPTDDLQIWYWDEVKKTLIRVDSNDSNITYIGSAEPGTATSSALWQITRLTQAGAALDVEYAGGNDKFDNIFDNREVLSYS